MRTTIASALALLLGIVLWGAAPASAKGGRKDPCAKADARLARTGQGDTDGDGVSDCRERLMQTAIDNADTDHDGMSDGKEMHAGTDANDPDSDHDGIDDGDDDTPALVQKVEALLDAITCPTETTPGTVTPGTLTALGINVSLTDTTQFEDTTCADLAASLTAGEKVFVKVKILEDMLGALSAQEVEGRGLSHDGDDDQGEDENDD
jgi:Domain of unknown function (DUF5666)/Bacterial TSP3 repeat